MRRLLQRIAPWAARLALATASVGLVGLGFELAVRHWIPGWTPPAGDRRFWSFDESLGWRHVPGQEGRHRHVDFDVHVKINERGLRDRPYEYARNQRQRMLFLGDSFGWGFGVEREQSVSERLEARHAGWEIVNGSVSGYGTDQQLLWYRAEGRKYRPDLVFVLFHPNDFHDNSRYSRYGYRKPLFAIDGEEAGLELTRVPVQRRPLDARIERWLVQHVSLYPRLTGILDDLSERFWDAPAETPVALAGVGSKRDPGEVPKRITARLLAQLAAEVRADGARLVVASVRMWDAPRGFLEQTLADLEVPYLPLDAAFAEFERSAVQFPNDAHWNAEGHRVAADAIERFLVDETIFVSPLEMAASAER